jgi:hypothetical protein
MATSLFPGKGAHLVLNEAHLQHIMTALDDIANVYSDQIHDDSPVDVIHCLTGHVDAETGEPLGTPTLTWTEVEDKFGHKAFAGTPYKTGELRVTAVLTSQGELRLDIREWFSPS